MSKIDRKKTTWTVSPTRKKVIILMLSTNTEQIKTKRKYTLKQDE